MLEDIPLQRAGQMRFMNDDIPAHFPRIVRRHLNIRFKVGKVDWTWQICGHLNGSLFVGIFQRYAMRCDYLITYSIWR